MNDEDLALLRQALETSRTAYARQSRDLSRAREEIRRLTGVAASLTARLPRLSEALIHAYADTVIAAETWVRRPSPTTEQAVRDAVRSVHAAWMAAEGLDE